MRRHGARVKSGGLSFTLHPKSLTGSRWCLAPAMKLGSLSGISVFTTGIGWLVSSKPDLLRVGHMYSQPRWPLGLGVNSGLSKILNEILRHSRSYWLSAVGEDVSPLGALKHSNRGWSNDPGVTPHWERNRHTCGRIWQSWLILDPIWSGPTSTYFTMESPPHRA